MKCPLCKGKGEIALPPAVNKAKRREQARILRKAGLSLTVIMKALGYKSPRSVVLAVNRKD